MLMLQTPTLQFYMQNAEVKKLQVNFYKENSTNQFSLMHTKSFFY